MQPSAASTCPSFRSASRSANACPSPPRTGTAGVRTHGTIALVLGASAYGGTRRAVSAKLARAITHRGCYHASAEQLTPVPRDPPSAAAATFVIWPGARIASRSDRSGRQSGRALLDHAEDNRGAGSCPAGSLGLGARPVADRRWSGGAACPSRRPGGDSCAAANSLSSANAPTGSRASCTRRVARFGLSLAAAWTTAGATSIAITSNPT
jgi:hypothetical protein